uniref:Uncharacterized protein n=1 Tax=Tetraodon nigroviridis TaxID=99883 RepID=H3BZ32_TETNG
MENKNVLQLPAKSYHDQVDQNPKPMHHQCFNPTHTNVLQPNGFLLSGLLCSEQKPVNLRFFNSFTFCKTGNVPEPQPVEPLGLTVKEEPPLTRVSKMETIEIESAVSSGSSTQSNSSVSATVPDIDISTREAAEILLLLSRTGSTEPQ